MHRQTLEREERLAAGALEGLPTLETGVVVVAPGEGNRRLFKSLRATRVIEGGQTMNPSTEEIVAAVDATPATEVIVLPNNSNVILSAEQAVGARQQADAGRADALRAGGARGDDRLRPASAPPRRTRRAMMRSARGRRHGRGHDRLARRRRSTAIDVRKGAWLGLADGDRRRERRELRHRRGGGRRAAARRRPRDPDAAHRRRRAAARLRSSSEIERAPPGASRSRSTPGGQPHYPLLLSAE